MTSFWSLAALLAFGLVGHATAQFSWNVIVGSCTATCGPTGVKPSLTVCLGPRGTVDEVNCDRNTKPPYRAPEPCNRKPCEEPPMIAVPQPLVQNPPIPGGNNAIAAGQNVQIHANNSLWIDVNMAKPGIPTATFSWSLPGGETVNSGETSGRFQVHDNGTLVITNIGLGDEGNYKVTASNSAGSDSITSTVTVLSYRCASNLFFNCSLVYGLSSLLEPPMIFEADPLVQPDTVPYQGFTIDAGQNVSMHQGQSMRVNSRIVVGCVPDPSIEWTLPNGSKLGPGETSNGVRITQNGALRIDDVRRSDDGTYTVTATNSQGTDTASTTLKVLLFNWETIKGSCTHTCGDQGITPFLLLCRDELEGRTDDAVNCNSATRPPQPLPEPCNRIPCPKPPVLATPDPLDQTFPVRDGDWSVTLGQNVTILKDNQLTIDAQVISGFPTPTITWTLPDGTTLSAGESSDRVSVSSNGTRLTIQGIQDSDRGSYVATAENEVGTATGTTAVTVIEPPVFRTPPTPPAQTDPIRNVDQSIELGQNILIRSGNELVIDAVVTEGSPNPTVVWTLPDGGTLGAGERSGRYRVSPNGRRLTASNMQVGDGGMFVATATNDAGSTTGRSQVTVVEPPVLKSVEPLDEPSPIPNEDFSIDVNQDVFILAGRRLLVNAELTAATPPASISWSLPDGSSLSPGQTSGRYRALANGSLEVTNIELGDEGVYTVTATNRAGSVTGSTTVTVRSK
ncbi:matrix-remodeling-associated protein 5-like [Oscarella lobularis]|uniref:matrix-remodeling-associated protein 5-like n=1 Tax=Oscarella lobularis TaxID=121494 RepID=UPI003313BC3A